jgi:hypothetical protein
MAEEVERFHRDWEDLVNLGTGVKLGTIRGASQERFTHNSALARAGSL